MKTYSILISLCRKGLGMSFRASRRRVEKSLDLARDRSVFEWISPLSIPWGRFGRNDGGSFLQNILILIIMVLCTGTPVNAKYSGGTGEPNDPYRIATAEDLNDIGNYEEDWE